MTDLLDRLMFLTAQCDGCREPKRMQAALVEAADEIKRQRDSLSEGMELRAAAERMVQTYRDWMAGCDNGAKTKDVEAAHINLRDALAKSENEIGTDQRTTGAAPSSDNASHSTRESEGAGDVSGSTLLSHAVGTIPREPTQAMLDAPNTIVQPYAAKLIWQRMYDAAPQPIPSQVPKQEPTP